MNIYEQLNAINDVESLSEKYIVKNIKELKKLTESTQKLDESMDQQKFQGMKKWIEETDPDGRDFAYDGPYADYVDAEYMEAVERYNRENGTTVSTQASIQSGYGITEIFDDEGHYASRDFEDECDMFLEFANDANTVDEFRNMMYSYVEGFAACMKAPEDKELNESTPQGRMNRKLASDYLTVNDINPKLYQVHHLNGEVVSEIDSLKDNSYDNILFVKKGFKEATDDVHKLIHIAARLGGVDQLIRILDSWNSASETANTIYAVDPADKISLIPISIDDAVVMTQFKQVNVGSKVENPEPDDGQLKLDI